MVLTAFADPKLREEKDNESSCFTYSLRISDFRRLIEERYPSRKISDKDPTPISIEYAHSGPLHISGGSIMCEICGGIIRENYLQQHRDSGACSRKAKSRREKAELTRKEASHNLSDSSEIILFNDNVDCADLSEKSNQISTLYIDVKSNT